MVGSTFDMAETAFKIALGLTGVMCLWLGIMRIGEKGGAVDLLARVFGPLLRRLFPGIPAGHPASGSIVMNMAANMLGLDNAATPLGLKAMGELQELNPDKDTASNDQILFLVINTSAVTVVPVTIFTYRAQMGAADPTDIFLPILIATYCSTLVGLLVTALFQKIRLCDPVVLGYLGGMTALIAGLVAYFGRLDQAAMEAQSSLLANFLIFAVIIAFMAGGHPAAGQPLRGLRRRRQGRLQGRRRASSPTWWPCWWPSACSAPAAPWTCCSTACAPASAAVGLDTRLVDGLPTALMKPLSGSGARGMMIETMQTHGADSLRRPPGQRDPGQHRDHLLRAGGVLRSGGHQAHAATRWSAGWPPTWPGSSRRSS